MPDGRELIGRWIDSGLTAGGGRAKIQFCPGPASIIEARSQSARQASLDIALDEVKLIVGIAKRLRA
jgi:hypothetical protein